MADPLIIPDVPSLQHYEGRELGASDWTTIDQARIDAFAAATGDDQWIHVDPERARRESPFGTTIAHGYLTLSLAPTLLPQLVVVADCSRIVNSGIDKLRLREPVLVGSRIRLGARIASVRSMRGSAARVVLAVHFDVEGAKRPACSGELTFIYYP